MGEPAGLVGAPGEDVVSPDGQRSNVLRVAAVFSDGLSGQRGFVNEFRDPLASCRDTGSQYQGGGLQSGHARQTDDGFPGPAGQHDYSTTAARRSRCIEGLGRLSLIMPQLKTQPPARLLAQVELKLFALAVACQVFDGIADIDQGLFQSASLCRFDKELPRSDTLGQEGGHILMENKFIGESCIRYSQH